MDLATIDSTAARLRATVGLMSTNLVDLENDAGRARLDQATLTGTTAERWVQARADLACLWQWFTQLKDVLEQAAQLRGTRSRLDPEQLAQLDGLVNGPSIELSRADVPLARRGLFGPTETTIRCSPPELLDRMRIAFDQVVAVIGGCTQKWGALEGRLRAVDDQQADARRMSHQMGEEHQPELDQIEAELAGLRRTVTCDPLAAPEDSLAGIGARLGSLADDLRRLAQLKDSLVTRLSEARAQMVDLRAAAAAAAAAREEALAKIVHPVVIDPRSAVDDLDDIERELARAESLSARGDWRASAGALVPWATRCREARAEADRALAANQAPIATRNELRGRLDAYRAKAYRLGRLEDPVVAALHARARAALFTAPTDLDAAEQLVRSYQQTLAGPVSREAAP